MSYDIGSPQSFAALDSIRKFYDERDPLNPGMWRYTDATGTRIGKLPGGDDALWDFISRADAKFGIVEDKQRWVRLAAMYGLHEESSDQRMARIKRKGK